MTTNQKQFEFTKNIGILIVYATVELGLNITQRECQRFKDRQMQLVAFGRSKTMNSLHLDALASDLLLFRNGQPVGSAKDEDYQKLGAKWRELGGWWGGDWGWEDAAHFQWSMKMMHNVPGTN